MRSGALASICRPRIEPGGASSDPAPIQTARQWSGFLADPRSGVRPPEQVAERLAPEQRRPPASAMLGAVVDHVAPLTERGEIGPALLAVSWSR